jgi:uncharacterized protein YeaO (DUF488 family)
VVEVFTARINVRDPDVFNVTRQSGAAAFAPSWSILRPALDAMRRGGDAAERAWGVYVADFTHEMRESYRANRWEWDALLMRRRVCVVCYCANYLRCHRTLLARDILPKLGAVYRGEIVGARRAS